MNAIEYRNAKFEKLSPARKRVVIAADVIRQVRAYRYIATKGTYIDPVSFSAEHYDSAVEFARGPDTVCRVCARGAMFLSILSIFNNFTGRIPSYPREEKEQEFFDKRQTKLIEGAFEGWGRKNMTEYHNASGEYIFPEYYTVDMEPAVLSYVNDYPSAEDRLIAIMRNVIKNRGTFIP